MMLGVIVALPYTCDVHQRNPALNYKWHKKIIFAFSKVIVIVKFQIGRGRKDDLRPGLLFRLG